MYIHVALFPLVTGEPLSSPSKLVDVSKSKVRGQRKRHGVDKGLEFGLYANIELYRPRRDILAFMMECRTAGLYLKFGYERGSLYCYLNPKSYKNTRQPLRECRVE